MYCIQIKPKCIPFILNYGINDKLITYLTVIEVMRENCRRSALRHKSIKLSPNLTRP